MRHLLCTIFELNGCNFVSFKMETAGLRGSDLLVHGADYMQKCVLSPSRAFENNRFHHSEKPNEVLARVDLEQLRVNQLEEGDVPKTVEELARKDVETERERLYESLPCLCLPSPRITELGFDGLNNAVFMSAESLQTWKRLHLVGKKLSRM